jgi:hypothetical protein
MKNIFNGAMHHYRKSFATQQPIINAFNRVLLACSIVFICVAFIACQKQDINKTPDDVQSGIAKNTQADVLNFYSELSQQTLWELQKARASTSKYRNIENAIKDGYQDIAVDVEHMGHHFMKTTIVDSVFDITQPEILVYNKDQNGDQQLVAVEYAVPLSYPKPEGFAGSADEWNGTSGFPLWLLHAWVWAYNPDGVFNWTNASVELH